MYIKKDTVRIEVEMLMDRYRRESSDDQYNLTKGGLTALYEIGLIDDFTHRDYVMRLDSIRKGEMIRRNAAGL